MGDKIFRSIIFVVILMINADACWKTEEYHRALKEVTNVKGCRCREANAQRPHISLALRVLL